MKIKLLTSMAGADGDYAYGEIADIENATAKRLIESGQAEEIKTTKASKSKPAKK